MTAAMIVLKQTRPIPFLPMEGLTKTSNKVTTISIRPRNWVELREKPKAMSDISRRGMVPRRMKLKVLRSAVVSAKIEICAKMISSTALVIQNGKEAWAKTNNDGRIKITTAKIMTVATVWRRPNKKRLCRPLCTSLFPTESENSVRHEPREARRMANIVLKV